MIKSKNNDLIRTENDRLEEIFLNWIRNAFIFFIAGVTLYNFVDYGATFSVVAFLITIYLLLISISDYMDERNRLSEIGIEVYLMTLWICIESIHIIDQTIKI